MPDNNTIPRSQPPRQPLEFPDYTQPKRPPPSIHEGILATPVQFEQDTLIVNIRTSLAEARNAAERAYSVAVANMTDERRTEVSRHQATHEAAFKITSPALQKLQTMAEKLGNQISQLEVFLQGPPEPLAMPAVWKQTEIRNALAALSREKRREIVLAAIKASDQSVACAVLRTPAFVAGIDPVEQEEYRLLWAQSTHPNQVEYLQTLRSIDQHLGRGAKLLLDYSLALSSPVLVKRADASQRRAEAALAGIAA